MDAERYGLQIAQTRPLVTKRSKPTYCVEKLRFRSDAKNLGLCDTSCVLGYGRGYRTHARSAQCLIRLHSSGLALVFGANDLQLKNEGLPNLEFFNTIDPNATLTFCCARLSPRGFMDREQRMFLEHAQVVISVEGGKSAIKR